MPEATKTPDAKDTTPKTPDLGGAEGGAGSGQRHPNDGAQFPEGYTNPMDDLDAIAGKRPRDDKGKFKGRKPNAQRDQGEGEGSGEGSGDQGQGESGGDQGGQGGPEGHAEDDSGQAGGEDKGDAGQDQAFLESSAYKRSKPLREAYDRLREEHAKATREAQQLKQKLEQGDYNTALAEENTTLKQRIKDFQARQVVEDYQASDEYQSKYMVPMTQLIDSAASELDGVMVEGPNGSRPADKNDFLELIDMPINSAGTRAKQLFGDAAPHILSIRAQIRTINDQRKAALKDAEKNAEAVAKKRIAERAEQEQHHRKIWLASDKKVVERYPDVFGEIEGDTEHNRLIEKGLQDFDSYIYPNPQIPQEHRLAGMAQMRRYAATFPAILRKNREYEDRIEELEAELAELRDGDPDGGGDGGGGGGGGSKKGADVRPEEDPDAPWNKK